MPWPWLLAMRGGALVGPRNRPHVTRVPHGLRVATMDHVGVLVALDAKRYMGLGPLAPFANIPSEHHHSTPTQSPHLFVPFLAPWISHGHWVASTSTRNAT